MNVSGITKRNGNGTDRIGRPEMFRSTEANAILKLSPRNGFGMAEHSFFHDG